LVADREGRNIVAVRNSSTLREVSTIVTADPPPLAQDGDTNVDHFFDTDDHLVTVSGSQVERWNPHTGQREQHLDLTQTSWLSAQANPSDIEVRAYPATAQVAVTVRNDPVIHILDLRTGRDVARLNTGADTIAVDFDLRSPYFGLLRKGGIIELWRRTPLRKELDLPPLTSTDYPQPYVFRFLDAPGRFLLAANNTVRVYQVDAHKVQQSYSLGTPVTLTGAVTYQFFDASGDAGVIAYGTRKDAVQTLSLRPADWRAELCHLIGRREFTAGERAVLPVPVPPGDNCG
jgi:hypothetical protein